MAVTTNMGLTTWASGDSFNDQQLRDNWTAVDVHDHTTGKGKQIPSNGLQKDSVTETKIADGSVTSDKLVDESISQYKLAPDLSAALERAKISLSENTVFGSGLGSSVSGGYLNLALNPSSVSDVHISNAAFINPSKIAISNASGEPLSNGSRLIDLSSSSGGGAVLGKFGASTIAENAIGTSQITNLAVTNAKIADGTIAAGKLAAGVIPSFSIPDNSITTVKTQSAAWDTFPGTMSAIGNNPPNYGSSSRVHRYRRIHNVVHAYWVIDMSSFYTGYNFAWTWNLPVASFASGTYQTVGAWTITSAGVNFHGTVVASSNGVVLRGGMGNDYMVRGGGGGVSSWPPFWTTNQYVSSLSLSFSATYEAA